MRGFFAKGIAQKKRAKAIAESCLKKPTNIAVQAESPVPILFLMSAGTHRKVCMKRYTKSKVFRSCSFLNGSHPRFALTIASMLSSRKKFFKTGKFKAISYKYFQFQGGTVIFPQIIK